MMDPILIQNSARLKNDAGPLHCMHDLVYQVHLPACFRQWQENREYWRSSCEHAENMHKFNPEPCSCEVEMLPTVSSSHALIITIIWCIVIMYGP